MKDSEFFVQFLFKNADKRNLNSYAWCKVVFVEILINEHFKWGFDYERFYSLLYSFYLQILTNTLTKSKQIQLVQSRIYLMIRNPEPSYYSTTTYSSCSRTANGPPPPGQQLINDTIDRSETDHKSMSGINTEQYWVCQSTTRANSSQPPTPSTHAPPPTHPLHPSPPPLLPPPLHPSPPPPSSPRRYNGRDDTLGRWIN